MCTAVDAWPYEALLRVRTEGIAEGHLVAVVEETFGPQATPGRLPVSIPPCVLPIAVGDRIGGNIPATSVCDGEAPPMSVGTELLVLFNADLSCADCEACRVADCESLAGNASAQCVGHCAAQTGQVCEEGRSASLLDGRFYWAVAWQEPLDFGEARMLSTSEAGVLSSASCHERFPPTWKPSRPCNEDDTPESTACSAAAPRRRASSSAPVLLVLAAILGRIIRRRRNG